MKIEFDIKINSDGNKFESQLFREKIESSMAIYAKKLPEIYSSLDNDILDSVTIHLVDSANSDNYGQEAFTIRNSGDNNQFVIAISQFNGPTDIYLLLAHELCHVAQFLTGMMDKGVGIDSLIWKGDEYLLNSIPHQKRPWEQDALRNQWKLYDAHADAKRFSF